MRPLDLTGQRFGRLIASERIRYNKRPHRRWICHCDCGNETIVITNKLISGHKQSCGCLNRGKSAARCRARGLPNGVAAFNSLLYDYRYNARQRGLTFTLTEEEFRSLTQKPCKYCGSQPANVYTKHGCMGGFIYNGIDRVDNTMGYLSGNCVPCCKFCNYAKNGSSKEEFQEWLQRLRKSV